MHCYSFETVKNAKWLNKYFLSIFFVKNGKMVHKTVDVGLNF